MLSSALSAAEFASEWQTTHDRVWLGEDYWANPIEDWRVVDGRIECLRAAENRNVALLTHVVAGRAAEFEISVRLGKLSGKAGNAGFRIGIHDDLDDYRSAALRGTGLNVGVTARGAVYIDSKSSGPSAAGSSATLPKAVRLTLRGKPQGPKLDLTLVAADADTGATLNTVSQTVNTDQVAGLVALAQNSRRGQPKVQKKNQQKKDNVGNTARFWFADWKLSGPSVEAHPDRAWGPILWAMHSVSRHTGTPVMKLTAQMAPIGEGESQTVLLSTQLDSGKWDHRGQATIDPLSRTATFRLEGWDMSADVPYVLSYMAADTSGKKALHTYKGTVRREPDMNTPLVVAGFTGNTDTGFPNREIARNVEIQDPHILFFSGDQIYEFVGGYGIIRQPDKPAVLNYLRKWYLFGWAFGDLMRNRPTLCLADDHDVYQGNIWGQGGIDAHGMRNHAKGGYAQSAAFVNAVQRTQTSHHPDPFDSAPVAQDISVYYGPMLYGGCQLRGARRSQVQVRPAG